MIFEFWKSRWIGLRGERHWYREVNASVSRIGYGDEQEREGTNDDPWAIHVVWRCGVGKSGRYKRQDECRRVDGLL